MRWQHSWIGRLTDARHHSRKEPPTFQAYTSEAITITALRVIQPAQATHGDGLAEAPQKSFQAATAIFREDMAGLMYTRFTTIQKGAVMGFCHATSWENTPKIWHNIEATNSNKDLQRILKMA